jgi:hypothetical protein
MTEDMQVRNFSPHTQNSYVQQVSLFARHFSKSPELLGPEEIRSYQVYLTNAKNPPPTWKRGPTPFLRRRAELLELVNCRVSYARISTEIATIGDFS